MRKTLVFCACSCSFEVDN